eukprot:CAMPEP_0174730418 /NCGR_PEP_ID=MMETSP1094-20130205/55564_1 /TAXON_ID=156173 /ORGANISM="Chrysochromulina brevifilum, Strain UTEX LB 985" /LENGTH=110 /DNA_ID=CAMNT_0015932679 /DNA_START=131 /DNA_END=464 /DNA_ORIENTATION=+
MSSDHLRCSSYRPNHLKEILQASAALHLKAEEAERRVLCLALRLMIPPRHAGRLLHAALLDTACLVHQYTDLACVLCGVLLIDVEEGSVESVEKRGDSESPISTGDLTSQ